MEFSRSRTVVAELEYREQVGSTNDELVARENAGHFSVLVTLDQTAGKGRLDRSWVAPAGKALAVSVRLVPRSAEGVTVPILRLGWLPLIAGLAMTRAVASFATHSEPTLKWPNDVLIDGRKVCGILTELTSGGQAVVIGAGLNLTLDEAELPVPTATSLVLAGVEGSASELADLALSAYLSELKQLTDAFLDAGGDVESSGIRSLVKESCGTLGQRVRVQLPGAADLYGVAEDIDDTGRLVVRSDSGVQAVAAGDVTHLRYE